MQTPKYAFVYFVAISLIALAESDKAPRTGNSVKVFDDAIFETKKVEPGSDTMESASGSKRYRGAESKTTTDRQEAWNDQCAGASERGSPDFRKCVRKLANSAEEASTVSRKKVQDQLETTSPGLNLLNQTRKAPAVFEEEGE